MKLRATENECSVFDCQWGLYKAERDAVLKHRNREGPGARTPSRAREKLRMRTRRQPSGRAMQSLQTLPNIFSFYTWYQLYVMNWQHSERQGKLYSVAYQDRSIDDTEFALLYDFNSYGNLEFPYRKYGRFDLDSTTDDE